MSQSVEPIPRSAGAILDEAADMIRGLSDEAYRTPGSQGASIGQHTRHTLDHFARVVAGHGTGTVIDYDRRERGGAIETDRAAALHEISGLIGSLAALDPGELGSPVTIRVMVNAEGDESEIGSTLARELWFATHHAIHHNALIKAIAADLRLPLPASFGRAPSTVHHEEQASR